MNYKKLLIFVLSLFLLQNIVFGLNADSDLLQYLKLDNDATDSYGSIDGTNQGVSFNGSEGDFVASSDDYIDLGFSTTNDFTFNVWVKAANLAATWQGIFSSVDNSNQDGLSLRYYDDTPQLYFYVCSANVCDSNGISGVFAHSTWTMITVSKNGNTYKVYQDGTNIFNVTSSKLTANDNNIILGRYSADSNANEWDGKMKLWSYWNRSLNLGNVTDLYNDGINIISSTTPQIQLNISDSDYFSYSPIGVSMNTTTNVNMSIYLNGVLNQTFTDTNYTTTSINIVEGNNNLSFKSEDVNGINWNNISVTLDTIAPNISIIGNITQDTFEIDFSTIFNVTDLNLDTCTIDITYLENITNASQYDTFINCTDTEIFYAAGLYNGFIEATDLAGNIATLSINGTIAPIIYINFKDVYGNNINNYSANIIHPSGIDRRVENTNNPLEVSPVYNGSLDLGNYTFIFDKLGYQLQNFTISVNETSGGQTYNFTVGFSRINVNVFDRDTLNTLAQLVNFELLNNGGNPYGAIFNTSTGNTTFTNSSFINGNYILRATSSGYNAVEYYFTYSGQENATINLYMVQANKTDDAGDPVIVDVKIVIQDAAGFNVGEGYIIKVLQQYASEGGDTFIVDSGKSNVNGEVLLNLEYNSIFYSLLIENNEETLKRVDTFKITKFGTNCALGECYYFSIGEAVSSGDKYATADNTDFNLRYVNISNTTNGYIQFTFNNKDNLVGEYCLDVYQKIYFDYQLIDTSCLEASSGVISTIINGTDDNSFKGVGYVVGDIGVLGTIYVDDEDLALEWGIYGLVGTIILLFVAVGIGGYAASKNVQDAPAITLALIVGVMWATDTLKMVKWGYVILFTVTLIVGVIIWLLYRRK